MPQFKALGLDGFQAVFDQKAWNIVRLQVSSSLFAFLNGGEIPEGICDILIILLSKTAALEQISQFRLISLCNVTFKIITKILVNRMKLVLPKLVSPMQSNFILGRQLNGNVVVLQEIIHSMRNHSGWIGWMVLKIDLEKAYDRL